MENTSTNTLPHPIEATFSVDEMNAFCEKHLTHAKALHEQLRQGKPTTWEQGFVVIDKLCQEMTLVAGIANLMSVTNPKKNLRDAAMAWEPKVSEFLTNLYLDAEVYQNLLSVKQETCADQARQLLQDETLREYRRNGLDLSPENQQRLKKINLELTEKAQAFESNLASKVGSIEVTPEQLDGLPQNYKDSHLVQENGLIRITSNTPDYVPFMKYAKDRTAAHKLFAEQRNRAKTENLPLLDEVLALRREKATLLGYENWASYVLEPRMAKNPQTVKTFLEEIQASLKPVIEQDLSLIRSAAGISNETKISAGDVSYLMDQVDRTQFSLDSQLISEYFELFIL
jgi:thimet oligopeptidase